MSRRRRGGGYRNPSQIAVEQGNKWYNHYYQYLASITYQLFEWENLPSSVDPRFLEMSLHMFGFVGFYKDEAIGYIATQGAASGKVDHYYLPTEFHASSPNYQKTFKLFNYSDLKEEGMGVIIWNNDYHTGTLPSIELFASELAETQQVISVNRNAQKTPILLTATDNTKLSVQNAYSQIEGNAPAIITHETMDPNSITVFKTDAPYVVDKLRSDRDKIWNEIMTYLGIKNANLEKKERMITAEADSNDGQILASANIYLKTRLEACKRINELYPDLNVNVKLRVEVTQEIENNLSERNEE